MERLRRSGKTVLVHLDSAGLRELYLAGAADRVWLLPSADLMVTGMGAHLQFYGDLLARLGIRADMEAAGSYKSFGEPYTRSWPSASNREQVGSLVADLQAQAVAQIAEDRQIEVGVVEALLGRAPLAAEEAKAAGLVAELAYGDQVEAALRRLLGGEPRELGFGAWLRVSRWRSALRRWGQVRRRIAIVHLEGPVVQGAEAMGGSGFRIDSDRIVPVLRQIAQADDIAGVVLHVDSPGGSAVASDILARAVQRLTQEKPVVAVFGDVAASGGYYLAAPAQEVIARAGTITGSIGVVGGKIVVGAALERIGVHGELVAAGPDADLFAPWSAFTPDQRLRFRASLQRTYDRFIDVVAAGRRVPASAIEPHAQGRVWTGRQAMELGLVDRLGGLETGIARLRLLAGLEAGEGHVVHIRFPPPRLRVLQALLGGRGIGTELREVVSEAALPEELAGARVLLQFLRGRPGEALALLPWKLP